MDYIILIICAVIGIVLFFDMIHPRPPNYPVCVI